VALLSDTCILCRMKTSYLIVATLLMSWTAFGERAPIAPLSSEPYTGAIVVDVSTGKTIIEDGADKPVYPASVVKLMDLLLILERIERGELSLDDSVRVDAEAARMGGSQVYLKEGEVFSLDEMLFALSIKSANDVAVALATHVAGSKAGFVKLMNRRAAELGMEATRFASVHGLPPEVGQKPDVTTARDIARLSLEVVKHPKALAYTSTREKWFRNNTFQMVSHNRLLGNVAGCDGLKTGYFRAGGFSVAATAERKGRRIVAVVMGCKSRPERDAVAQELLVRGFAMLPSLPDAATPVPEAVTPIPGAVAPLPAEVSAGDAAAEGAPETTTAVEPRPKSGLRALLERLQKGLTVVLIVVLAGGALICILYAINRRRDRWKYKL
jgi:serine-type D-Ala-D-Ala carboxypeptidase (penicillin-binding protein 5/6)